MTISSKVIKSTAVAIAMFSVACSGPRETVSYFSDSPVIQREFRAAWVATVANIDWPSEKGLPSQRQQAELRSIMDRAVVLNLNALVLQIRPATDALYASDIEPWSEYLTGSMGVPPSPIYDPLEFAVDEAHKRGLEIHVWFNPFRALHPAADSPVSEDHISVTRPDLVKQYGDYMWLDPGEREARLLSLSVILDVVDRYDIDGVHMDDYFYPYDIKDEDGNPVPFPDSTSWQIAQEEGVTLQRDDWRRENINMFVKNMYEEIKARKPWVKVGLSPFGIWRPGFPEQIEGYDAYARLFADSKKWLNEGWIDYFTPQLYWSIEKPEQSYPVLLDWWIEQNQKDRHIWPGNYTSRTILEGRAYWDPEEIIDQIAVTRSTAGASGNVHFSMKALFDNGTGMSDLLASGPYTVPALVPAVPWLTNQPRPRAPYAELETLGGRTLLKLDAEGDDLPWLWTISMEYGDRWMHQVVPGWKTYLYLENMVGRKKIRGVSVRAVNRYGLESRPTDLAVTKR